MTISSEDWKNQYDGTGSQTSFSVTFQYADRDDVVVIHTDADGNDTTWVRGTQYTLTGPGVNGTLTVSTSPVDFTPASDERLTIYRDVGLTQNHYDKDHGTALSGPEIEASFDHLTFIAHRMQEQINRGVLRKQNTETSGPLDLPEPEADGFLAWNTEADALENKQPADIADASFPASSTDNALARFDGTSGNSLQGSGIIADDNDNVTGLKVTSASGSTSRALEDRFDNVFNVFDFGATGDGVTDDSDAIQSAIDAASAAGGGIVFIPEGTFLLNTARSTDATDLPLEAFLVLKDGVSLVGAGRYVSTLRRDSNEPNALLGVNGGNGRRITGLEIDVDDSTGSTAVHGILSQKDLDGLLISENYIHNTGSYGIGLQDDETLGAAGFKRNCVIRDNIIDTTGADGIDIKGRNGDAQYGNAVVNNRIRAWGNRNTLDDQAGIDFRGPLHVSGNTLTNVEKADGNTRIGIRARSPGGQTGGRNSRIIANFLTSDSKNTSVGITYNDLFVAAVSNIVSGFTTGFLATANRGNIAASIVQDCTTAFDIRSDDNIIANSKISDIGTGFDISGSDNYIIGGLADGTLSTPVNNTGSNNRFFLFRGVSNTVRFEDGSASTPGITFVDDPDTGFYRVGADVLGASVGGSERFRVTSTDFRVGGTAGDNIGAPLAINGTAVLQGARFLNSRNNLGDDAAVSFTPADTRGLLVVMSNDNYATIAYNTSTGVTTVKDGDTASFTAVNDTALGGTDGADGDFTVSANSADGQIYFENRTGGTVAFAFNIQVSRN